MHSDLLSKIRSGKAVIGVIGLGYVGLPLVREFARAGCRVIGFDVDASKIKNLKAGKSYIEHIPSELIASMIRNMSAAAGSWPGDSSTTATISRPMSRAR